MKLNKTHKDQRVGRKWKVFPVMTLHAIYESQTETLEKVRVPFH